MQERVDGQTIDTLVRQFGVQPRDFSAEELAAAPVLTSIDSLLLDLTEDEDDAFAAALAS